MGCNCVTASNHDPLNLIEAHFVAQSCVVRVEAWFVALAAAFSIVPPFLRSAAIPSPGICGC